MKRGHSVLSSRLIKQSRTDFKSLLRDLSSIIVERNSVRGNLQNGDMESNGQMRYVIAPSRNISQQERIYDKTSVHHRAKGKRSSYSWNRCRNFWGEAKRVPSSKQVHGIGFFLENEHDVFSRLSNTAFM